MMMNQTKEVEQFWRRFLEETGRSADTKYIECFHFDLSERVADALLALVLSGQKRATATSIHYFENAGTPLPEPGSLSVVTDWAGNPRCVIETTAVAVLPFREITWDICKREGEDESLASWQEGHIRFFTEEGKNEGYVFSWDMPVVFEDFRVVYSENMG